MGKLLYLHFTQREALAAFIGAMTGVKRQKVVRNKKIYKKQVYMF